MLKEFKIYFQNQLVYVKAQNIENQWWFQWKGGIFVVSQKQLEALGKKPQLPLAGKALQKTAQKSSLSKEVEIVSPVPAQVVKILLQKGKKIAAHKPLLVLSSMKMEHTLYSPAEGSVKSLKVKKGDFVKPEQVLMIFCPDLKNPTG